MQLAYAQRVTYRMGTSAHSTQSEYKHPIFNPPQSIDDRCLPEKSFSPIKTIQINPPP